MAEKTDITDLLIHGVDIRNRRIYFGMALDSGAEESNDINDASVEYAIRGMHRMALEAPDRPIEIHMSSYGGSVDSTLRLHDEILACPCQVKFYGGGVIMSGASFIMCVSDERYLHVNTRVMLHEMSAGVEDRYSNMKIDMLENSRIQDKLNSIYANNSRMPKEFWEDICEKDVYLDASEAVSLGLADKIIEPRKRGQLRKVRQAGLKKPVDEKNVKELVNSIYKRINKKRVPKIVLNEFKKEEADASLPERPLPSQPQTSQNSIESQTCESAD